MKIFLSTLFVAFVLISCNNSVPVKESIQKEGSKINIKSTDGMFLSSHWDEFIYANKQIPSDWEVFVIKPIDQNKYVLQAHTNKYLSADLGSDQEIESNRDNHSTWESFELVEVNDSTIAFKADNGKYITVKEDSRLYATSDTITSREQFIVSFISKK